MTAEPILQVRASKVAADQREEEAIQALTQRLTAAYSTPRSAPFSSPCENARRGSTMPVRRGSPERMLGGESGASPLPPFSTQEQNMPSLHFHVNSSLSPSEVMGVLTNFSPSRVEQWPSIDAEHFQVHERGETWAEVTEGNDKSWEHARYEWDPSQNRVTVTTHDSTPFGSGGWNFQMTPTDDGTRVDVELERHPSSFKAKMLSPIIPFAGPVFRKSFKEPLKTV